MQAFEKGKQVPPTPTAYSCSSSTIWAEIDAALSVDKQGASQKQNAILPNPEEQRSEQVGANMLIWCQKPHCHHSTAQQPHFTPRGTEVDLEA